MNTVLLHNKVTLIASAPSHKTQHNMLKLPRWCLCLLGLILVVIIAAFTGCASSKYRLADKDTPPPAYINLSVNQQPVEVLLNTVIVYKGPGSWKRKAYWDEYIITFTDRSDLPASIVSATIVDFQDKYNSAGDNPWALEKQSKTWWKNIRSSESGRLVTLGLGTAVILNISYVAGWAAIYSGSAAVAGVALAGAAAGIVVLPVYAKDRS